MLLPAHTVEWETPQDLFDAVDQHFSFTVDVAASDENHKCERYYTKEQNGLQQDWCGEVIWCNPPYDAWSLAAFTVKAIRAIESDPTTQAVFLVPVKADQAWFHRCACYGSVWLISGRVRFGQARHTAPMPVCLIVMGGGRVAGRVTPLEYTPIEWRASQTSILDAIEES